MDTSIEARLREAGLGPYAAPLAALARPCVQLPSRAPDGAELPVGATKLGGAPDLPDDAAWPERKGVSLAFLLQIDLRDVAGMPGTEVLPLDGLLSFFYEVEEGMWGFDPADRGSWRVLHTPPDVPLRRRDIPAGVPEHGCFAECALEVDAAMSLPPWEGPEVAALGLDDARMEIYGDLPPREGYIQHGGDLHQLLGWPDPMQSPEMESECQAVSSGVRLGAATHLSPAETARHEAGAAEWRLLMQVDTDDNAGVIWGDAGKLYFWIRESDLAARRWENVWMILQCG